MTFFSVPPVAVTVMPADGSASAAPFAGVIFTSGTAAAALGVGVGRGPYLAGTVPATRARRRQQGQRHDGGRANAPPQPPARRAILAPYPDRHRGPHIRTRSPERPVIYGQAVSMVARTLQWVIGSGPTGQYVGPYQDAPGRLPGLVRRGVSAVAGSRTDASARAATSPAPASPAMLTREPAHDLPWDLVWGRLSARQDRSEISPSLLAAYTASARRRAPSFAMTLPTWNFTVAAEMYRRCPIATLLSPRASRTRISRSRGVMSLAAAPPGPLAAVHPADDDPGAAGVEGALSPVHGPDRPDQLGQVDVLDHEALRALLDGLQDQPLIRGTGQHEHPDVGVALGYRGAQGQAVALAACGQPQIEEHHPGTGPVEHRRGQPGGRRLADHLQIRFPVDHGPQALPDDRVVVDDGRPGSHPWVSPCR